MRTIRIYVDIPLELNNRVVLPSEAARHVHKVLRMQPDDPLTLFNGDGHEYIARITEVKPGVTVDIIAAESAETESPLTTHIGLCLNRSERMDYAIQKSTELGVSHIHLVHSRYCDVQLKEERLQKTAETLAWCDAICL